LPEYEIHKYSNKNIGLAIKIVTIQTRCLSRLFDKCDSAVIIIGNEKMKQMKYVFDFAIVD
jgi:hypothetical protein